MSNKALGIFTSIVILVVLLIAFFVLKPESESTPDLVVKEEQPQKDESKNNSDKNSEQKASEDKYSESKASEDKSSESKASEDKPSKEESKSEDKSNSTNTVTNKNNAVEDEIEKRKTAQVEERKKTKKRLDEQLEIVSKEYTEKLTGIFETTEKEYLKLKETSKGDSKALDKFVEEKSVEIGTLYKESNVKIIDFEWKNPFSEYGDFEKWKKPFAKIYEEGMESFIELHSKTSKELADEAKKKIEEEKAKTEEKSPESKE